MRSALFVLALTVALAVPAGAQLSAEATPNPAPQGTVINVKVEATIPAELRLACPLDVRAGSPSGPIVWKVGPCILLLVIVGPGRPYTRMAWNGKDSQNRNVPPGTYYIHIQWRPARSTQPFQSHFVPVRIDPVQGPNDPVLSTTSPAKRGQTFGLKLSAPQNPNDTYIAAASFTTNTGFNLTPNEHVALDPDSLLALSLIPLPGLFTSFQGTLDVFGVAGPAVNLPNVQALQGAQISVQCLVIDGLGFRRYSNPITRVIL